MKALNASAASTKFVGYFLTSWQCSLDWFRIYGERGSASLIVGPLCSNLVYGRSFKNAEKQFAKKFGNISTITEQLGS